MVENELTLIDGVSLTTNVYDVVSEMLLSGALKPGDQIPLRRLAEQLGVSVMPIRQAIGRLAARGALRVEPKRAAAVPILRRAEFLDLTRNRIHLESWAASLAARNGMDPVLLGAAEQAFRSALSHDDAQKAVRANKAFHFHIYAAAGSPVLLELVTIMWLKAGPIINLDVGEQSRRTRRAASLEAHARLVAAILRGDEDVAAEALAQDIRTAADFILSRNILLD
ncbi:GntR family transcriptional regulator [Pikeienuella sp. HZG-20]|uniref:GntR family transcriptional regulator n=1 Tax=Paludibacillus litoralis TaxID=3133267 RepID=UPI0030EB932F